MAASPHRVTLHRTGSVEISTGTGANTSRRTAFTARSSARSARTPWVPTSTTRSHHSTIRTIRRGGARVSGGGGDAFARLRRDLDAHARRIAECKRRQRVINEALADFGASLEAASLRDVRSYHNSSMVSGHSYTSLDVSGRAGAADSSGMLAGLTAAIDILPGALDSPPSPILAASAPASPGSPAAAVVQEVSPAAAAAAPPRPPAIRTQRGASPEHRGGHGRAPSPPPFPGNPYSFRLDPDDAAQQNETGAAVVGELPPTPAILGRARAVRARHEALKARRSLRAAKVHIRRTGSVEISM